MNTFILKMKTLLENPPSPLEPSLLELVTNKIPEFDGRYAVFGQIVKGFEVLEKIEKKDLIYEIQISN